MKKYKLIALFAMLFILFSSCGNNSGYLLGEDNFFLVMTNMQYYPQQYVGKDIDFDCFTYDLADIDGKTYRCGVRKCSSGYGCQCGKDTVIGFLLDYDGEIPVPKNQSEDTVEKSWIHVKGTVKSSEKTKIKVYALDADGNEDRDTIEYIEFLTFKVEELDIIEDYTNLKYYVTK